MFAYYEDKLKRLEESLKTLELEKDDLLTMAEQAFELCVSAIEEIKTHFKKYRPQTEKDEIRFFKNIEPRFVARLIYYLNIYNIESNRPNGSVKIKRKYFQIELNRLKHYFDENLDFYRYYRTGSTYLDYKYFIKGKQDIRLRLDSHFYETDPDFSTSNDFKVATILANDLLQVYLENELTKLDFQAGRKEVQFSSKTELQWTGSKVALTELLYALHAANVFNHGGADIKSIATYFLRVFDIELGEYYRTYLELRLRNNPTRFMDNLKATLVQRMEEDDAR